MGNIIGRMGTSGGFVGRMGGSTSKALETMINDIDSRVDTIITTPVEGVSAQEIIDARQGALSVGANITEVKTSLAQNTPIKGTTQTVTFDVNGTVQKVQHINSSDEVIREDVFTFTSNSITEVRTMSSGGSLTLVTNLDTLETEVI